MIALRKATALIKRYDDDDSCGLEIRQFTGHVRPQRRLSVCLSGRHAPYHPHPSPARRANQPAVQDRDCSAYLENVRAAAGRYDVRLLSVSVTTPGKINNVRPPALCGCLETGSYSMLPSSTQTRRSMNTDGGSSPHNQTDRPSQTDRQTAVCWHLLRQLHTGDNSRLVCLHRARWNRIAPTT